MGTLEWIIIGFIVFVILIIIAAYLFSRWLYKEKQDGV